jgi:hypothetical protein
MPARLLPLALAHALAPDEPARPVPGASRYWITDHGRLFSTVNGVREMRLTPHARRYLQVDLWRDTDRARTRPGRWRPYVHELVALAFIGPRPAAPGVAYEIDHLDGDKANNRLGNLQFVPRSENLQRALAAGRNPTVKLSAVAVWTYRCRAYAAADDVVARAARECGASVKAVRRALAGRSWRSVPDPASRPSAGELAAALPIGSEAEARRLLTLSPFSPDYVGTDNAATARVLPFRSSDDAQAA